MHRDKSIEEIKNEVKAMIAKITESELEEVTDDAHFVEDLGMDSLMALEILTALEKNYKIRIPEDNLRKMTSLREAVEIVQKYA